MTFEELLYKRRGTDWHPPEKLIAIDPGETAGIAIFLKAYPVRASQIKVDLNPGARGWDPLVDEICTVSPDIVVYEDYRIYANKVNMHTHSNIPTVKIIGAIEFVCSRNNYQVDKMSASTAKGFVTTEKLKEWGFYQKGLRHGMDAARVGLHYLLFSKELT